MFLHTNTNIFKGLLEEQETFIAFIAEREEQEQMWEEQGNFTFFPTSLFIDLINSLSSGTVRVSRREMQRVHLGSLSNFCFSTTKAYLVFVSTWSLLNTNWCKEKPDWLLFKTAE